MNKYILFCPHPTNNFGYAGTEAIDNARLEVLKAIKLLPNERFRIKLHPSYLYDKHLYFKWQDTDDIRNATVVYTTRLANMIEGAKLVIVQHSSVALEAIELGKPVILVEDEVSDVLGEFSEFPKEMFMRARTAWDIIKLI